MSATPKSTPHSSVTYTISYRWMREGDDRVATGYDYGEETYVDAEGVERCDNCDETIDECDCRCDDCGDHIHTECACSGDVDEA